MIEWYEKLSTTKKYWLKRGIAAVLCVVVVFATMPSTVSSAAFYQARILRNQHLTGDDMLSEVSQVEGEETPVETPQDVNTPDNGNSTDTSADPVTPSDADTTPDPATPSDVDTTPDPATPSDDETPAENPDDTMEPDTPSDDTENALDTEKDKEVSEEEETVDAKVTIEGLDSDVACTISFEDTDGNSVGKNEDDTYTLVKGMDYTLVISEMEDYVFVSINGNASKQFTYEGDDLTIVFEKETVEEENIPVTLASVVASITVSGIPDTNNLTLTFTNIADTTKVVTATNAGSGTYQAELEVNTAYTVSYGTVAGYYVSKVKMASEEYDPDNKKGGTFDFTYKGEDVTFIFSAIPKMYSEENGDITLIPANAIDLSENYGISDFNNYNDGSAFTLSYTDNVKSVLNHPYLIVNNTDKIQITTTENYQMVVEYVSGSSSKVNLTLNDTNVGNAASDMYNEQYYDTLLTAGTYTIGGSGDVGIVSITLYKLEERTYTVNLQGGTTPADTELIFANSDYGITRTAKVTDGKLQVQLQATTKGITYEVTKTAGTGINFIENTNEVTINRSSSEINTLEIESSGAVEITFAAKDTAGADFDATKITGVNVIYNKTTTPCSKVDEKYTTPSLIVGNKYSFSVEGVPTYAVDHINVTIDGNKTENVSLPYQYLGTETEIELVFAPRENLKVYFDLTEEDMAVLTGKGITLDNLKFSFTPIGNSGQEYTDLTPQKDGSKYYVELIKGTYNVKMSSDALDSNADYSVGMVLDQIPYELGSTTVNVEDDGDIFYMDLSRIKEWYFYNDDTHEYYPYEINGKKGYYKGIEIDASTGGKLDYRGDNSDPKNDTQLNPNTYLSIPVDGACTLTLTLASNLGDCIKCDTDKTTLNVIDENNKIIQIIYTGEKGFVQIYYIRREGSNSNCNILSLTLKEEVSSGDKKDPIDDKGVGPYVAEDDGDIGTSNLDTDGNPRRSKKDTVTVTDNGQRLTISQTNGGNEASFIGTSYDSNIPVGYYIFKESTDYNTLTFDMKITSFVNNNGGVYVGAFSDNYMYTAGFRGNTAIQKVYSSDDIGAGTGYRYASNSSDGASTASVGEKFKVTITRTSDTAFEIKATSYADDTHTVSYDYKAKDTSEDAYYYGLLLDNVTVEVSNLLLITTEADSTTTTVYNQNDYYYPYGSYPTPRALYATATEVNGKSAIKLSVLGETPAEDGFYVLQRAVQSDSSATIQESDWTTVEEALYATSFTDDTISAKDSANYVYRIKGQLGRQSLGGNSDQCSSWVTSKAVNFEGALAQPVVTVSSTQTSITLKWDAIEGADYYTIYRFKYGETQEADDAHIIKKKETGLTYTDSVSSKADSINQDDPYYYYVKAVSQDNESLFSEDAVVWEVAASNRSGYDYDANEIFITNRSYETVFDSEIKIEGLVNGSGGTIALYVNGSQVDSKSVADREAFSFTTNINQGRNDVYLLFTSNTGTQTKKAFNYVYATDFDAIVDASFTGTDGTASTIVTGATIPTYKTITEALKKADGNRYVVLVLEGEYDERLVVTKENVTLLGEDMEKTIIHNYPGNVGGDMDKRCATYIQSSATNFHAENLTFKNDYPYTGKANPDGGSNESADAVRCDADGAQFIHCTLDGMQDTLFMGDGQQYYEKCHINGIVDYIYCEKNAKAFFNECMLTFQSGSAKTSGYVVAPRTGEDNDFGMVFYKCGVLAESGCTNGNFYLARPWGAGGMAVWIQCFMGKSINKTTPYASMSGVKPEQGRFFEWYSYGSGYEINTARRQISRAKADEFYSEGKKTYHHDYKGSLVTAREKKYTSATFTSDEYSWSDGDDSGMADYFMEGYATDYGVSGGGLLKETSSNYYAVSSADEFLQALVDIKSKKSPSVIELQADICLGSNEVDISKYASIIKPYAAQPLTHPTLLKTGVSVLTIDKMSNLTIFSSNASSIKHANIDIKASSNIMIRNIVFDELWEWDEDTSGDYDRNDWDYMTIEKSDGVWIDHCTFYKAYDGVIDIKSPNPTERVTISWCQFRPGSEGDTFFNEMMNYIKENPSEFPTTYEKMLHAGMTEDQIKMYAYGQKKTHLFGQSDTATDAKGIKATLANNYYYDSMDRLPRLRYGYSHVYNCIMDSQGLLTVRDTITDSTMKSKIVSNGAASTCGGQVLLEDCYISGIVNALNSGNGSSPAGYINAINSVYYMNGTRATLEVKNNTSADDQVLITDANSFRKGLGYDYSLKNAINLFSTMLPYCGAGSITLTTLQWEKTDYNVTKKGSETSSVTDAPTSSDDIPDVKDYDTDIKTEETVVTPPTVDVIDTIKDIVDNMEEETTVTETKQENEKTEKEETVAETKKPGDIVMVNGKAYTIADTNGTLAYRVAYAIPESVLTPAIKSATGANSINDLIAYLKNDIVNTSNSKFAQMQARDVSNTAVFDLAVVILQPNGEWIEVTKENFPSSGLDVLIPYPSGTSGSTHRFGVSHLIVLGCNGKAPGTIEYLTPTTQDDGLKVHVSSASPFTVIYEALSSATQATKQEEESAGSKWVTAQKAISSSAEEDEASRARNGDMSTRQTLDSVMGSGYLIWVTLISIAIMWAGNYQYYRFKKKQEMDTGIAYGDSMAIL